MMDGGVVRMAVLEGRTPVVQGASLGTGDHAPMARSPGGTEVASRRSARTWVRLPPLLGSARGGSDPDPELHPGRLTAAPPGLKQSNSPESILRVDWWRFVFL